MVSYSVAILDGREPSHAGLDSESDSELSDTTDEDQVLHEHLVLVTILYHRPVGTGH